MAKKALVFGLGLLGGGVATTNWLIRHGYEVTITDLRDEKILWPSLKKIKGQVQLALGGHQDWLMKENDLVVANPDVSIENPYLQLAQKLHKEVANEATIFYTHWNKSTIGVTGTRGKTTTVNWLNHFLKSSYKSVVTGNSSYKPFLTVLDEVEKYDWAVTELPSFLLELFDRVQHGPEIAVITNLSQDHLNRHHTLEEYARVKANIFKKQTMENFLVLNADDQWTDFFLKQNPIGPVRFFSMKPLANDCQGVFYQAGVVYEQKNGATKKVLNIENFIKEWGEHNAQNLLASLLAAALAGCSWKKVAPKIKSLPHIPFRQEVIFADDRLKIINDTTATSSEGGIAAMKRFGGKNCILITGGTDRQLDFSRWAKTLLSYIPISNVIFLRGSATQKMFDQLQGQVKPEQVKETLKECLERAQRLIKDKELATILFSPAAKSFEKFKNEYDRGERFNDLAKMFFDLPSKT